MFKKSDTAHLEIDRFNVKKSDKTRKIHECIDPLRMSDVFFDPDNTWPVNSFFVGFITLGEKHKRTTLQNLLAYFSSHDLSLYLPVCSCPSVSLPLCLSASLVMWKEWLLE